MTAVLSAGNRSKAGLACSQLDAISSSENKGATINPIQNSVNHPWTPLGPFWTAARGAALSVAGGILTASTSHALPSLVAKSAATIAVNMLASLSDTVAAAGFLNIISLFQTSYDLYAKIGSEERRRDALLRLPWHHPFC